MSDFSEMRNYARKVDDGIKYLQNRIKNPREMSVVTPQSAHVAASTLSSISSDLETIKVSQYFNLIIYS